MKNQNIFEIQKKKANNTPYAKWADELERSCQKMKGPIMGDFDKNGNNI